VGSSDIYWIHADGTGAPFRLTESGTRKFPTSWHPNGKLLAFEEVVSGARSSILTVTVEGDEKHGWKLGEIKRLSTGPFAEIRPAFSPDGRWLSYFSNESGNWEIYVRAFPGPGSKWQVSTGGGLNPKWSLTSKELFYSSPDNRIMVVPYTVAGESFSPGKPHLWSPGQFTDRLGMLNYDVHPDGKRVAVLKTPIGSEDPSPSRFAFVLTSLMNFDRKFRLGSDRSYAATEGSSITRKRDY
jgi:eukaryotic-like serine/threonine-protein kinase